MQKETTKYHLERRKKDMRYKIGMKYTTGKWEYLTTRLGADFIGELLKEFIENPKISKINIERTESKDE